MKTTYLFDVTWSRNEAVNHVSWYAHERAEREKPSNRFSPPWEIVPEDTVYSPVFFERHDKEHLRKERVLSVYSAKRHYCFVTLTYTTSCQYMPNGCTHILYCVTWHLFLTVVYVYTTKIDGSVCPPNISETVTVRTVKLAHRPRIASTTIKFISKPILLSILYIILKKIQPIGADAKRKPSTPFDSANSVPNLGHPLLLAEPSPIVC